MLKINSWCPLMDNTYIRIFRLTTGQDTSVSQWIDVVSSDFDVMAWLVDDSATGAARFTVIDDDRAGACDARLAGDFGESGRHFLVIGSNLPIGFGKFTVHVSSLERPRSRGLCPAVFGAERLYAHPWTLPEYRRPEARPLSVNDTVFAFLTAADPLLADGRHAQTWSLLSSSNDSIRIDLVALDRVVGSEGVPFDPILEVYGDSLAKTDRDGGERCGARVQFRAVANREYKVVVSSEQARATGTFKLAVSAGSLPQGKVDRDAAPADTACAMNREYTARIIDVRADSVKELMRIPLKIDDEKEGGIAVLPDGRGAHAWTVQGVPNSFVTISAETELSDSEFDLYLYASSFRTPHALYQADDTGDGCNPVLRVQVPDNGRLRIDVSTHQLQRPLSGRYTLRVTWGEFEKTSAADCQREPLPETVDYVVSLDSAGSVERRFADSVEQWILTVGPEEIDGSRLVDSVTIDFLADSDLAPGLDKGQLAFDPKLRIRGPGLRISGSGNRNNIGTCGERVSIPRPKEGRYLITLVGSRGKKYRVRWGPEVRDVPQQPCHFISLITLAGRPIRKTDVLQVGTQEKQWRLRVSGSDTVAATLDLMSGEFDPFLRIVGPDLDMADANSGVGCNARLAVTLLPDTSYLVTAATRSPADSGEFHLRIVRGVSSQPVNDTCVEPKASLRLAGLDRIPPIGSLDSEMLIFDRLVDSDSLLFDSTHVRLYTFHADSGQSITFDLQSDDFDPYLWLFGVNLFVADDDGGGACYSRITISFPSRGTYRVAVNSYSGNVIGSYTLKVDTIPTSTQQRACEAVGAQELAAVPLSDELVPDSVLTASLSEEHLLSDGTWALAFMVEIESGTAVTVDVFSRDFEPFVSILSRKLGFLLENGRVVNCNTRIRFYNPVRASYRVVVSSRTTGDLRLRASVGPTLRPLDGECGR
jgi:hypothetical protein